MSDKSRSRSRSRSQQKYQPPTQPEPNQPTIYIGGLSIDTQEFDLREIFEEYGAIVSIRILPKDTFALAFVTYSESSSAAKALEERKDQPIQGKRVKMSFARPRPPRQGGNFGGRGGFGGSNGQRPKGCFKCGKQGHMSRQCTEQGNTAGFNRNNNGDRPKGCFKCGQQGHMSRQCPNSDQAANNSGFNRNNGDRSKNCFKCHQEGHFARQCPNADQTDNLGTQRSYNNYNRNGFRGANNHSQSTNGNSRPSYNSRGNFRAEDHQTDSRYDYDATLHNNGYQETASNPQTETFRARKKSVSRSRSGSPKRNNVANGNSHNNHNLSASNQVQNSRKRQRSQSRSDY